MIFFVILCLKKIENMDKNFKELISQVNEIIKKYENISKQSGENFNIFKVIRKERKEFVHTFILSDLLNPKGSHGQGSTFLEIFLKQLNISLDIDSVQVKAEKYIGEINNEYTEGGRIDIFIADAKKNCIVIENKIDGKDQHNQLLRYYNYCKYNVLYLTLDGREPEKISYGNLKLNEDFHLISYKTHIIEWLEKCKEKVNELVSLREAITQYMNLVKILTYQTKSNEMEKDIRDAIVKTSDNLKSAIKISNNLNNAKVRIHHLFWKNLKNIFENRNYYFEQIKRGHNKTGCFFTLIKNFHNNKIDKKCPNNYFGLKYDIFQKEKENLYFLIEIDKNNIYYGFSIKENNHPVCDQNKYEKYRKIIKEIDKEYLHENQWWLGRRKTETLLDFKNFNPEVIKLADDTGLNEVVKEIVDTCIKDIEEFKAKCNL